MSGSQGQASHDRARRGPGEKQASDKYSVAGATTTDHSLVVASMSHLAHWL